MSKLIDYFVLILLIFAVLHHRLYNIKQTVCSFFVYNYYINDYDRDYDLCRSLEYNSSMCQHMGGYHSSGGFCYFSLPSNCSALMYVNCQCYATYSTTYTNATCINIGGVYRDGRCYYHSDACPYYSFQGQCYNRRSSWRIPDCVYNMYDYYCYYNRFE